MKVNRFRSPAASLLLAVVAVAGAASTPVAAQTRQAFRVTTLALADPQIWTPLGSSACSGPINALLAGVIGPALACDPPSGDPCTFDFNIVAVFDPLIQTAGANPSDVVPCMSGGEPCQLQFAVINECTRTGGAAGTVTCGSETSALLTTTYSNGGATATCLAPHPGTSGANNSGNPGNPPLVPATGNATNNCGVSGLIELTLTLGDGLITIPLKGASLAARYNGNPATGLTTGLARGFLSEAAADEIMINVETPIVINAPLSQLLPGGTNNCRGTTQDDSDTNPPDDLNGERGWWFHLTFAASAVTVPEFPTPTPEDTPTATAPVATDTPEPTDTPIPTDTPLPTDTPVPTSTPPTASCPGDCNGDGAVTINEVQRCANIFLEVQDLATCASADRNGSGGVTIDEVVTCASRFQLDDCGS